MTEDMQNLPIPHQMFIVQYDFISLLYSRRENVVETPWGRRAVAIHVEDAW